MPITICFSAIQNQIEGMKKAQSIKYSQAMYRRSISLVFKTAVANSHLTVGSMDVYAVSSFGIFLLAMRQRNPKEEWLKSSTYKSINKIVNAVCLEQFSEDDSEATSGNYA